MEYLFIFLGSLVSAGIIALATFKHEFDDSAFGSHDSRTGYHFALNIFAGHSSPQQSTVIVCSPQQSNQNCMRVLLLQPHIWSYLISKGSKRPGKKAKREEDRPRACLLLPRHLCVCLPTRLAFDSFEVTIIVKVCELTLICEVRYDAKV